MCFETQTAVILFGRDGGFGNAGWHLEADGKRVPAQLWWLSRLLSSSVEPLAVLAPSAFVDARSCSDAQPAEYPSVDNGAGDVPALSPHLRILRIDHRRVFRRAH
jgi:hypothetical protein